VLEGLRMRAGRGAVGPDVIRVTVLLALAMWTLGALFELHNAYVLGPTAWLPVVGALVVVFGPVVFGLVARGRFGPATLLAAVGVVAGSGLSVLLRAMAAYSGSLADHRLEMLSMVVLLGAAVLRRRPPHRARAGLGTLAFAVVLPLLLVTPGFLVLVVPDNVILFLQVLPVALVYLGAVGYVAVDPRPALAVAAFLVLVVAQWVALVVAVDGLSLVVEVGAVLAVLLVAAVVAVAAAALGLRRQAAVLPTRIEG
jgi:hypothetical protein